MFKNMEGLNEHLVKKINSGVLAHFGKVYLQGKETKYEEITNNKCMRGLSVFYRLLSNPVSLFLQTKQVDLL